MSCQNKNKENVLKVANKFVMDIIISGNNLPQFYI